MAQVPPSAPPPQPGPPAPGGWQGPPPTGGVGAQAYAEWWKRVVGALIDGLIVSIPSWILMGILGVGFAQKTEVSIDPNTGQITGVSTGGGFIATLIGGMLVIFLLGVAYYVYFHGNERGQTVGKMAMKTAVKDEMTGGSIGYGRAAVRWLVAVVLWAACYVPGIVDALFPLWDDKRQTLHDKAVKSVVVDVA